MFEIVYGLAILEFFAILYLYNAKIDLDNLRTQHNAVLGDLDAAKATIERLIDETKNQAKQMEQAADRAGATARKRKGNKKPDSHQAG